jgi:uncharacterized protein (DUF2252 family)
MHLIDPTTLAARQIKLDHARTSRFAGEAGKSNKIGARLFARKVERMTASPLAFLRGAAPLFYEVLAMRPDLARGPDGEGFIVGDLHLENFGAYHPDAHQKSDEKQSVAFDLNDFDDAIIAPWRFDLVRLTTSLILGGRELGANGIRTIALSKSLLDAYARAAFGKPKRPVVPHAVEVLLDQVRTRTRHELLAARTESAHGKAHFVRGERYLDLPRSITKQVPDALARFAKKLDKRDRLNPDQLTTLDTALRIAGTGSLGSLRIAALVRGKGGADGSWIFDLKEQGAPSACALIPLDSKLRNMKPSERVVQAFRSCVESPPRLMGTTTIDGLPMFVRRLAPQEDKLDLTNLRDHDLDSLAEYLGALVGSAHRRGATKKPRHAWNSGDLAMILDRAITLAGIHEATYLAYCKAVRV